ncbi:hypothetical protein N9L20_04040 [Flavobacteriaceae bacterium]|nr:hypothetical protein [Flavobacteriaceae bacterium]
MKKYSIFCMAILLIACSEPEIVNANDSLKIESSQQLEVLSNYENGWIKEGIWNAGSQKIEFEYYSNGFFKHFKVFENHSEFGTFLLYEVSRNEENQPLWSKYYTPDGGLWFETTYLNGLPKEKIVYEGDRYTVHSYQEGVINSSKFNSTIEGLLSSIDYDYSSNLKTISTFLNGELRFERTGSIEEQIGHGINTSNSMELGNIFVDVAPELVSSNVSYGSYGFSNEFPITHVTPVSLFEASSNGIASATELWKRHHALAIKYAISDDLFQSVLEQYPFMENEKLFIRHGQSENSTARFLSFDYDTHSDIQNLDSITFVSRYGNLYLEKIVFGVEVNVFGILRNVPSNDENKKKVFELAEKKFQHLITGSPDLTLDEQELLDTAWFEVKLFSNSIPDKSGVLISSYEQQNQLFNQLVGENQILQKQYHHYLSSYTPWEE